MEKYFVAWWNLENLFDIEGSPRRTEKVDRTLKRELKGWSEKILGRKIAQISKIISKMNDNSGPDILGICEVENRWVIERLVGSLRHLPHHRYEIVHADTVTIEELMWRLSMMPKNLKLKKVRATRS